jgi:signal transduction histidine kinase
VLLRLLEDFTGVRRAVMRATEAALAVLVFVFIAVPQPFPLWVVALYALYFLGVALYAAIGFVRAARTSSGVTRRRMQAVAAGSIALGLILIPSVFQAAQPQLSDFWMAASRLLGLVSALAYFVGFAPPGWLRRSWQEPELRAFLGRAAALPRLPDTQSIVEELQRGAANAVGAAGALIGLWDAEAQVLRFQTAAGLQVGQPNQGLSGRTFVTQQPIMSTDTVRDMPQWAEQYRATGARAVLAAPITAGTHQLGTLAVYAARAPMFAEDDLELVKLLADQAAVILESRALIDEAARVRAREEAVRLKDDFISAAAHDLRTPLTTLVAQAQLMQRRAQLDPQAPPNKDGIDRMVAEAKRLSDLVAELLEALRAERGIPLGKREAIDLTELAREACLRRSVPPHRCVVEAQEPVVGEYDAMRMRQLVDNLLDNAVKYSPEGGEIRVAVARVDDEAHLDISDPGIGIPAADLPFVFDRYHRGTNVDDRRFVGLGLGLYVCRSIVEQHGGRIWATGAATGGTTFHVTLPLTASAVLA